MRACTFYPPGSASRLLVKNLATAAASRNGLGSTFGAIALALGAGDLK